MGGTVPRGAEPGSPTAELQSSHATTRRVDSVQMNSGENLSDNRESVSGIEPREYAMLDVVAHLTLPDATSILDKVRRMELKHRRREQDQLPRGTTSASPTTCS